MYFKNFLSNKEIDALLYLVMIKKIKPRMWLIFQFIGGDKLLLNSNNGTCFLQELTRKYIHNVY